MMRRVRQAAVVLVLLFVVFSGLPAPGQKTAPVSQVLPLSMVFVDIGGGDRSTVESFAEFQTKTQPNYKSGKIESLVFEGVFIPRSPKTGNSITVAVLSDDGVDVEVNGKLIHEKFGKGQHLPNLKESLHDLKGPDGGKWLPGKEYFIRIKYSNIIFTGDADIDGLTLFAYNGGGAVPTVEFVNETRGGDRVVSAKDKDLPGGIKELKVRFKNVGKDLKVTLKINRKDKKTSGSASFEAQKDVEEIPVKDGEKFTVFGRNLSGRPRDLEIQAFVDGKLAGTFELTVFRVELTPFVKGKSDLIPMAVKTEAGFGLLPMRTAFESTFQEKANSALGFVREDVVGAFQVFEGAIYMQGKVVPDKIDGMDFNRDKKSGYQDAFNMLQFVSSRLYFNECLLSLKQIDQLTGKKTETREAVETLAFSGKQIDAGENFPVDDLADPDLKDKKDTHLYVHMFDVARISTIILERGAPKDVKCRLRFNAATHFTYAAVPCSNTVQWYWAFSAFRDKKDIWVVLADIKEPKEDNMVGLKHIQLTPDLKPPVGKAPTVSDFGPTVVKAGDNDVKVTINGSNFTDAECLLRAYFRLEPFSPPRNFSGVQRIPVQNLEINKQGAEITGAITLPATQAKGLYTLQVIKGGHPAAELPDKPEKKLQVK